MTRMRIDAVGVPFGCRFSGWCWPNFSNSRVARRFGPAQLRGVVWNGAGSWLIVSQSRHETLLRTVWMIFHRVVMRSAISVMLSLGLHSRVKPQHGHTVGVGITTRSRGRCAGNGLRAGVLRVMLAAPVASAARSTARSSSSTIASTSSSWNSSWSSSREVRSERRP